MRDKRQLGMAVEDSALRFLTEQGLLLVARNFRSRCGEIDIIMREGHCLVFIEVRYRGSELYGHAIETINKVKQQKLARTAHYFLQKKSEWQYSECRFDVMTLMPNNKQFEWIKDAFQVEF